MSHAVLARKRDTAPARRGNPPSRGASNGLRIGEANDSFEREADRIADEVMAGGTTRRDWSFSRMNVGAQVQRKCACGGSGARESECEECKAKTTLQRKPAGPAEAGAAPSIVHEVLNSPGQPLDTTSRTFFEERFGHDFSRVRVHTDAKAAAATQSVNSLAYTVGQDVVFGGGLYNPRSRSGRQLLAHELTHIVQQSGGSVGRGPLGVGPAHDAFEKEADDTTRMVDSPGPAPAGGLARRRLGSRRVQRYASGEHAQFGETGDILSKLITDQFGVYTVKRGDTPKKIAARFGVDEKDLLEVDKAQLKHWKSHKKKVEGFNAGDTIAIPFLNDATRDALKSKELGLLVNGALLLYGDVIAMGDFYKTPKDMLAAPADELNALAALIEKEKAGKPVDWEKELKAISDAVLTRYHDLALENEAHFAPSNKAFAPDTGKSTGNHQAEWEKHHEAALRTSQAGDKNNALATNAFADHFLTDAFAAGHLFNKRDVMEMFEGNLPKTPKGDEFTPGSKAFFDEVAKNSFTGAVKTEFSKLETVACFKSSGEEAPCSDWFTGHGAIDRDSRFSSLLQGIHKKKPEFMQNAVAKGVHDSLNTKGVPVESAKHKWTVSLSGDGTLNEETKKEARKAVAQSQFNVLDVFKAITALDLKGLFKKVWDFVPHPTAGAGEKVVKDEVTAGTDPKSAGLITAIVKLIMDNFTAIIDKLITDGFLRKR